MRNAPTHTVRWAVLLVLLTAVYADLGAAKEPRVYGRGGTYITELTSVPLTPVDTTWNGVLPEGSMRTPVGSVGGALDLVRWPQGGETPEHARLLYWTAIVLGGELGVRFSGEVEEQRLARLSFLMVPAGLGHAVRCLPGSDCLLLMFQGGLHNSVVPSAGPAGAGAVSPDGIPPVILRLDRASWHRAGPGLGRGDLGAPVWAQLSIGASRTDLWRLEPGRSTEAVFGDGHSGHHTGLVIEGAVLLASSDGVGQRLSPLTYFETPRGLPLECVAESPCVLLAR
jgi:quercetin dioxygenase-like cupin family protein